MIVFLLMSVSAIAEIKVKDDAGQVFVLEKPVQRIISLAPHITESLFAAGASNQIIATVTFSDYPEQAKRITVIGDHHKYDFEKIIQLKPDMIIAWKGGNPADQLNQLQAMGFRVFLNDPHHLADVAKAIKRMGQLMGTESIANAEAEKYLAKLNKLQLKYQNSTPVKVFYQVWDEPLITVNGQHIISDVIHLCGGENIFEDLFSLAPRVSIESVMLQNPQAIVAGIARGREGWLPGWKKWKQMDAVKQNNLFAINADWITRHTPRILLAVDSMCEALDTVRFQR